MVEYKEFLRAQLKQRVNELIDGLAPELFERGGCDGLITLKCVINERVVTEMHLPVQEPPDQ